MYKLNWKEETWKCNLNILFDPSLQEKLLEGLTPQSVETHCPSGIHNDKQSILNLIRKLTIKGLGGIRFVW